MIKGIGCDIVSVPRISQMMIKERFSEKVYTAYEQDYIKGKTIQTAAGIWAAKEAVSKALGTGFSGLTAKDIEVRHHENGMPYITLYNGAEKQANLLHIERIYISISHEKVFAMATAIAE